jgi:hypothetical protein
VTLRQGLKPHGFFCLSSVRDKRGNGAWLRLSAYRSAGGKARNQCLHSGALIAGWCQTRWYSHALPKGKKWPTTSAFGVLGSLNTRIFRYSLLGNVPTRAEAFPNAILDAATLPKAVEWIPVPSQQQIAHTLANAVTFLRMVLRHATRTLLSSQGTTQLFFLEETKAETARAQASNRLTAWVKTTAACGGLKPFPVIDCHPAQPAGSDGH